MPRRYLAALAAACLPLTGHASNLVDNLSAQCSQALSVSGTDSLSWQCIGDLSIAGLGDGGVFNADSAINLSATGTLSLDNVTLTAPVINLQGSSIVVNGNVGLVASGQIALNTTAPITLETSPRQIVDWTGFDIGSAGSVTFSQGGNVATLPSPVSLPAITGALRPGGRIVLANPGGIVINGVDVTSSVPEPASWSLGLIGLLAFCLRRRHA